MEKTISFLLFIISAPKYLFYGDKMSFPAVGAEGLVAMFLGVVISFVPNIVFLLIPGSKETYCTIYMISVGISTLISLCKVITIKDDIVRTYFYEFYKISRARALCLMFVLFFAQVFLILITFLIADSVLK
ncbi:MAG: hypothetical protein J6T67_10115 [Paludibacteraceae bacterium]|nr:hypothetical protein [Paludibacteraceae bacterium]